MKARILALGFAMIVVLSTVLVGCSDNVSKPPDETTFTSNTKEITTVVTEATEPPPDIEAIEYNKDLRIVYYKNSTWPVKDISIIEESADSLESEIYRRNLAIEEKYKLNIVPTELAGSKIITAVENDHRVSDVNYDIIMPNLSDTMKLATNGCLFDVNGLEYTDYSRSWWNTGIMETTKINGKNYFAMGDANLSDYDGTPIILFNKDIITKYGLDDPYELVAEGSWTIDKMMDMVANLTFDADNNGAMDEADNYGVATNNFAVDIMLYGCDIAFATKDSNEKLQFVVDQEKLIGIMEKLTALFSTENTYFADRYGSNNQVREQNPQNIFTSNRSLFFPSLLQAVSTLRNAGNEFGILPTPKYNEAQLNYVSYIHLYTGTTLCIQENHGDIDMLSRVIEDMTYESSESVIPVYVEIALKSKHFKDEKSGEMLKIIFDSYSCDLANVVRGAGLSFGDDLRGIVTDGLTNVSSLLAKNLTVYENDFNKIVGTLGS